MRVHVHDNIRKNIFKLLHYNFLQLYHTCNFLVLHILYVISHIHFSDTSQPMNHRNEELTDLLCRAMFYTIKHPPGNPSLSHAITHARFSPGSYHPLRLFQSQMRIRQGHCFCISCFSNPSTLIFANLDK